MLLWLRPDSGEHELSVRGRHELCGSGQHPASVAVLEQAGAYRRHPLSRTRPLPLPPLTLILCLSHHRRDLFADSGLSTLMCLLVLDLLILTRLVPHTESLTLLEMAMSARLEFMIIESRQVCVSCGS